MKKTSLKKRATKRNDDYEMDKFFMDVWRERYPQYCFETKEKLPKYPLRTMFHHLLEKSKYPQYKFERWNIVLLKPEIHEQVHLNIDKTPNVKEATEIAKKMAEEYKNTYGI